MGSCVSITGMSGTGKSALLEELNKRGFPAVDTDYGDWHESIEGEWMWREDRIDALLTDHEAHGVGPLFVQGTTRNQTEFYPRFQHIVLLSAPTEVLIERLRTRANNPYGKDPQELAETLGYVHTIEPLLRASATLEVVTTIPFDQVADIVMAQVC